MIQYTPEVLICHDNSVVILTTGFMFNRLQLGLKLRCDFEIILYGESTQLIAEAVRNLNTPEGGTGRKNHYGQESLEQSLV